MSEFRLSEITEEVIFTGKYTGETWNGWDMPEFDLKQIQAIADWAKTVEGVNMVISSDRVTVTYDGEGIEWFPIVNGACAVGGGSWCWEAVFIDENEAGN